jgi:hypothetical protein
MLASGGCVSGVKVNSDLCSRNAASQKSVIISGAAD